MHPLLRLILSLVICLAVHTTVKAAPSTSAMILGYVVNEKGAPIADARIAAASPGSNANVLSDARGRFVLLNLSVGTYILSVQEQGYQPALRTGLILLPGESKRILFRLSKQLQTIGSVNAEAEAFTLGTTSDTYTISGDIARAQMSTASSSGLGAYTAGTVQGAIARVPGMDEDGFANAISRGGKVGDTAFSYDSVPIPQGLIAEPGGNVIGAQLPTTGIAATTVTLGGFKAEGDNALGGTVNEIPSVGTYPGKTTLELADGAGTRYQQLSLQSLWATPDLRWRYAFASAFGSEYFSYGDGQTFYPSESGTYGIGLQDRSTSSLSGNIHFRIAPSDDLSAVFLTGGEHEDQYGSPYLGETYGAFNGLQTTYPNEPNSDSPVNFASSTSGTYDIFKLQWTHTGTHALTRAQLYQSQFGANAGGPFWDDLSFPDGVISLSSQQATRLNGFTYDVDNTSNDHHRLLYGAEYRVNASDLYQVVPTADEIITSNPTLFSQLLYLSDDWNGGKRLDVSGTLRFNHTHIVPSDGSAYDVAALDPHAAISYKLGNTLALRAAYDHTTVAPAPLEADRTDSANPAPFTPLAPEVGRDFSYALEGGGKTQFRLTYAMKHELNRIDVLPFDFRSAVNAGENPDGVGIPTNAGELRANSIELWIKRGKLTFNANHITAFSSSASQFAYNDLNAAAVAAGHLFPVGYVPQLSASLSYDISVGKHIRITPFFSYESGYPYGNGTMVWTFDPVSGKPELIPNDNHVNPGYNYYFLQNPALPYNPASNPYIGNLGIGEGADPNTLRTAPQTLLSLHIEGDLSPRLTAILDIANLLGTATPTQMQSNPYLIGPPGYTGGNAQYGAWYGQQLGGGNTYTLGNGVPTNDGVHQALPWNYGRNGYVPESYPLARTLQLRLRYRL
jgi:Carboxypeptidase regulatory-like domain